MFKVAPNRMREEQHDFYWLDGSCEVNPIADSTFCKLFGVFFFFNRYGQNAFTVAAFSELFERCPEPVVCRTKRLPLAERGEG